MKHRLLHTLRKFAVWLLLPMGVNLLYGLALWLSDSDAFRRLWLTLTLFSVLLFTAALLLACRAEKRREAAFLAFLDHPDEISEARVVRLVGRQEAMLIRRIGLLLRENVQARQALLTQVNDYEEYVEAWAHEIKTPLSLLTFLLDNRRDELPPTAFQRLNHVRAQMQEFVDQMLYYARLKSAKKDYLFEPLSLAECCEEALENYQPLLHEKGFRIVKELTPLSVLSDRRGLLFIVNQILSNAVKYVKHTGTPELHLTAEQNAQAVVLSIRDNGIGVQSWDLPFLFQKGFTGDTGSARKQATGMGLYLANEMAKDLSIELEVRSKPQKGFEILLFFPIVDADA